MDNPIAYTGIANQAFEKATESKAARFEPLSYATALLIIIVMSAGLWGLVITALRQF